MTLSHILFGSNMGLRALNKIFLWRLLYFSYFDECMHRKHVNLEKKMFRLTRRWSMKERLTTCKWELRLLETCQNRYGRSWTRTWANYRRLKSLEHGKYWLSVFFWRITYGRFESISKRIPCPNLQKNCPFSLMKYSKKEKSTIFPLDIDSNFQKNRPLSLMKSSKKFRMKIPRMTISNDCSVRKSQLPQIKNAGHTDWAHFTFQVDTEGVDRGTWAKLWGRLKEAWMWKILIERITEGRRVLNAENTDWVHFMFQVDTEGLERGTERTTEGWRVLNAENTDWAFSLLLN